MVKVSVAERMTADQYLAIEQETRGWELIAGEVVVEEASIEHQRVATRLLGALLTWIRSEEGRGEAVMPLDVKLDHENVFAPDLLWYAGRGPQSGSPRPYPMPDLAVEVRSPSTWRYDLGTKKSKYEAHGLRELWLVDTPSQTVLVFRRSQPAAESFDVALEPGRGEVLGSPLLPGFALALDELFAD